MRTVQARQWRSLVPDLLSISVWTGWRNTWLSESSPGYSVWFHPQDWITYCKVWKAHFNHCVLYLYSLLCNHALWDSTSLCRTSCTGVTDLYIEVFADSVDSDSMKTSVCQITRGGSEDVRFLACLQVIPDLHTPWKTKHKLLQSNATLHLVLSVRWKLGIYRSKSNLVHITLPGFKYVYPAF